MKLSEVEKIVGKDRMDEFLEFMKGQTMGVYSDGELNYYDQDVDNFLRPEEERFFD